MKKTTKIVLGLIVIVLVALLIWGSNNNTSKITTVKFGHLPIVQALPIYVAIEKGYFKDEGLNIEDTKFESPNQMIDSLISGNIDVAMGAATGITAIAESKKPGSLRIFAVQGGDEKHIPDALIVSKDSSISSITDLKGKKVGTLPGIQWKTIARNIFASNNIDIDKDLTLVELAIPLQTQSLASKQVDALLTLEPVITIAESKNISKNLVVSPNLTYISNPFYAGVGNVSVSFMTKNPEAFKKVMKVLNKATDEINQNPDMYRNYLVNYTPLTPELANKVNLPIYKMYKDINPKDTEAVQKFIDIFVKYNVITNKVNASDLIIKK